MGSVPPERGEKNSAKVCTHQNKKEEAFSSNFPPPYRYFWMDAQLAVWSAVCTYVWRNTLAAANKINHDTQQWVPIDSICCLHRSESELYQTRSISCEAPDSVGNISAMCDLSETAKVQI